MDSILWMDGIFAKAKTTLEQPELSKNSLLLTIQQDPVALLPF